LFGRLGLELPVNASHFLCRDFHVFTSGLLLAIEAGLFFVPARASLSPERSSFFSEMIHALRSEEVLKGFPVVGPIRTITLNYHFSYVFPSQGCCHGPRGKVARFRSKDKIPVFPTLPWLFFGRSLLPINFVFVFADTFPTSKSSCKPPLGFTSGRIPHYGPPCLFSKFSHLGPSPPPPIYRQFQSANPPKKIAITSFPQPL